MSDPQKSNRLIHEKSPYLLQHAHNPIDWFPWGDEAFSKAQAEDKPIFLSIGYATCHWCHVMEKETFENEEIAKVMNDTFINIKVDREEHPEVDSIYMEFAQALMSSAGGWPLNVILTPDLKPFFALTYLPPKAHKGLIGMDQFASQIQTLWKSEEKSMLLAQADKIVEMFEKSLKSTGSELPSEEDLEAAVSMLFEVADPIYGGIKGEPKFPLGYQADFLLQYSKKNEDSRSLFYVELTLQMMGRGGIFDHLGGGFSRYCIDEQWHIPHFEKMLYDNAILARTYLEAYKYTKRPFFQEICQKTLDYILLELKGDEGGFFSAEDADTEGQEGKFYTWTLDEITQQLGEADGELFAHFFGVAKEGNFEGRNVLHMAHDEKQVAEALQIDAHDLQKVLHHLRKQLYEVRCDRTRPFKDDKVITGWNGLMIDVLAKASLTFPERAYLQVAKETVQWLKKHLFVEGKLLRRFREGDARFAAGLDDYAFLIQGVLSLFEAAGDPEHLQWAIELTQVLQRDFKVEAGAFYQTEVNRYLLLRKCEFYDGAEPSGNAVHCENLLRLYQLTQENSYLAQAEDILKAGSSFIQAFPPGACYHLIALQRYLDEKAPLVLVALNEEQSHRAEIAKALGSSFSPHRFVVWKPRQSEKLDKLIPNLASQNCIDQKTTLYVCKGVQCEAPLTELPAILAKIESL